jgi:hypothetical protein
MRTAGWRSPACPEEACTVGILARGYALRMVNCRRAPCDLGDIVLTREEESEKREEGEPPR